MSLRPLDRCPCPGAPFTNSHIRTDCPYYGSLSNGLGEFMQQVFPNRIFYDPDYKPDKWERWEKFIDPNTFADLCGPFGRPMPKGDPVYRGNVVEQPMKSSGGGWLIDGWLTI